MNTFERRAYKELSTQERDFIRPAERFTADLQDLLMDTLKMTVVGSEMIFFGTPVLRAEWTIVVKVPVLEAPIGLKLDINFREVDNPAYERWAYFQLIHKYAEYLWECRRR